MKQIYSFDKVGLVLGFSVIAVGSFIHYLVMVLGGIMVVASILAHIIESGNVKKDYQPEVERDSLMQEATG